MFSSTRRSRCSKCVRDEIKNFDMLHEGWASNWRWNFFFRRRIEYAVSTVRTIIFLGLIYGRALWLTLFSPRGSAPGRSFSRRAASSSQSERDSLPPAAWLVVAMDHFLSPTACSLPIRVSLLDRPYSRVVAMVDEGRTGINFKATSLAASPRPIRFACVPRMCVCNPLRKGRDPRPTLIGIKKRSLAFWLAGICFKWCACD